MCRKLTLVSAPASFGKTTLLSEWRMMHLDSEYPLTWVSLEEADNNPIRFLSNLIGALQAIKADLDPLGQGLRPADVDRDQPGRRHIAHVTLLPAL